MIRRRVSPRPGRRSVFPALAARPLRVQFVTRIFSPEAAAASIRLEALAGALSGTQPGAQSGALSSRNSNATGPGSAEPCSVRVLTTFPAPGTDKTARSPLEYPSAHRRAVRVERHQALRDATGYIRGYLPYLSFDIPAFFHLLGRARPDVYVVEPPPTTGVIVRALAALQRRPYVYYAADVWSEAAASTGAHPLIVWALRQVERCAWRGATRIITVSQPMAERLGQLAGPAVARRVRVVPNGIDTQVFRPNGPAPHPLPGFTYRGGPLLVYAGTASEWQGAEVFIEAFQQIHEEFPQAQILFLGQGTSWENIRRLGADLPAGTMGMDKCDTAQAAAWQRLATACLVSLRPGQDYSYAYPTKALAALASGTPVIYAGAGPAAKDISENQLGWAVPWETDAVAAAMRQALNQSLNQTQQSENAARRRRLRAWVENGHSTTVTARRAAAVVRQAAHTGR